MLVNGFRMKQHYAIINTFNEVTPLFVPVHRFLVVSLTCLTAVKSSHLQVVALAITNYERWHDNTKAETAMVSGHTVPSSWSIKRPIRKRRIAFIRGRLRGRRTTLKNSLTVLQPARSPIPHPLRKFNYADQKLQTITRSPDSIDFSLNHVYNR